VRPDDGEIEAGSSRRLLGNGFPAVHPGAKVTVQNGKRRLTVSNLDKMLYPGDGFTTGSALLGFVGHDAAHLAQRLDRRR
jgi:hypothetical protein